MARNNSQANVPALIPPNPTLESLRQASAGCRACDLWKKGTQTVFGEGSAHASVMLVGEQPGDKEDLAGHPFVGPAGRILDEALEAAGIDRDEVYVTNAVKHFSWVPDERGKRRIHKKPKYSEIRACRPWLDAEISVLKPQVIGKRIQRNAATRSVCAFATRAVCYGDRTPVFHLAGSG